MNIISIFDGFFYDFLYGTPMTNKTSKHVNQNKKCLASSGTDIIFILSIVYAVFIMHIISSLNWIKSKQDSENTNEYVIESFLIVNLMNESVSNNLTRNFNFIHTFVFDIIDSKKGIFKIHYGRKCHLDGECGTFCIKQIN